MTANLSPTQRVMQPADVSRLVVASLGAGTRVRDCVPLAGGGFAAVWLARLDDDRAVVVKVAPTPDVPLLRYERDLIGAEARCFHLIAEQAPQVPVPRVLFQGEDWLVTTALPGRTLSALKLAEPDTDYRPARADAGATMAALHRITGAAFGYDGGRLSGSTWPHVFGAMVDDLLADASDWDVVLGVPNESVAEAVRRNVDALAEVTRPALVYFDGWDGNLLVAPDAQGVPRLSGLVDGERFLFGDPLMDLVSPVMFGRIEDEPGHPFLQGYGLSAVAFDKPARRRLALYRMHLYVLMLVEMPSRGMSRQTHPERYQQLRDLVATLVGYLTSAGPGS
jgi:aminoglycoside phosphotransferase (APT) family kinase protein